jgi:hypothetical protein
MGQCWSVFGRMSSDSLVVDMNVKGLMVQERDNPDDHTLETGQEQQDCDTMDFVHWHRYCRERGAFLIKIRLN